MRNLGSVTLPEVNATIAPVHTASGAALSTISSTTTSPVPVSLDVVHVAVAPLSEIIGSSGSVVPVFSRIPVFVTTSPVLVPPVHSVAPVLVITSFIVPVLVSHVPVVLPLPISVTVIAPVLSWRLPVLVVPVFSMTTPV